MRRAGDMLAPLVLLAVLLAGWEIACRALAVPAYFLPPPSAVVMALVETGPRLAASAWATFWMALQALAAAGLIAAALALTVSLNATAERAVRPLAVTLQVTPVVAIAPLVLIWAGLDNADRAVVALAATVAFFPLFSGVLTGLKSADPDLERLFDLYGASPLAKAVAAARARRRALRPGGPAGGGGTGGDRGGGGRVRLGHGPDAGAGLAPAGGGEPAAHAPSFWPP